MIVVEIENGNFTFDLIDLGEGLPSLVEVVKEIRAQLKWELAVAVPAARMAIEFAEFGESITFTNNVKIS